ALADARRGQERPVEQRAEAVHLRRARAQHLGDEAAPEDPPDRLARVVGPERDEDRRGCARAVERAQQIWQARVQRPVIAYVDLERALGQRRPAARAGGASATAGISVRTTKRGRWRTWSYTRPRYSPRMPSATNCAPTNANSTANSVNTPSAAQ